jgi:hypothetical protein
VNSGCPSTSPSDGSFRLTSIAMLILAFISGSAINAQPSKAAQVKMPPYLDRSLFGGGDGLSKNTAIVVKMQNEAQGVGSEYAWIASRYPGVKPLSQLLTAADDDGKTFDVIAVQTSPGTQIDMWFDISAMYQWDMPSDYRWTDRERIWLAARHWAAPQLLH